MPISDWPSQDVESYASKAVLRIERSQLREEKAQLRKQLIRTFMDIKAPNFDKTRYEVTFHFLKDVDVSLLSLLGRDEVVETINRIAKPSSQAQKYMPVVISTSKGMGKTFLLKKDAGTSKGKGRAQI